MKRLTCLAATLAVPTLVWAAGPAARLSDNTALDFAVTLAKTKTAFDYPDGTPIDTTLQRYGITWYERVMPRIELGLFGGKVFLSQTENAVTAGIEPDGHYGGIGMRGVLLETSLVQLFLHASYAHQRVQHDETGRVVTLAWDEAQARLGATLTPSGPVRIYGGASWRNIDGQERVTGTSARTSDFQHHDAASGFVGIDLAVERDGYVGAEARSGAERGIEIYFKKRY